MERLLAKAVEPCPGDNSKSCPILDVLFAEAES